MLLFYHTLEIDGLELPTPWVSGGRGWEEPARERKRVRAEEILSTGARLRGEDPALSCQGRNWTYRETRDRVDRLKTAFTSLGVSPGDRLAILHRNCHRFLETYFAALELEAVLVPLSPRSTAVEMHLALEDSGASFVVSEPSTFLKLGGILRKLSGLRRILWTGPTPPFRNELFCDYEDMLQQASTSSFPESSGTDPGRICHLYYTSGSTGTPKGVQLTCGNLVAHVERVIPELGLDATTAWGHLAPMYHLADAWAVWAVTAVGGRHTFLPEFDPVAALDLLGSSRVNMTNLVPTMYRRILNLPYLEKRDFSHLRLLLSGGAPMPPEMVLRIARGFGCEYAQTYGLTETSPFLTISRIGESMANWSSGEKLRIRSTTGRPMRGVEIRVVREDGQEVPHDNETPGEILARGPTVSPGYWNRPKMTAASFADGWFKTGDLAVVGPEGYLTIVDRKKDLISVGGEKVYSLEVEQVLLLYPGLEDVAVFGAPDPDLGEVVMAVGVARAGATLEIDALKNHCRSHLSSFKVPRRFEFVEALPRTLSGKVLKRTLRSRYAVDPVT